MELLFAVTLGIVTSSGVYLLMQARTFPVVMGLTLLSYAVNLFLFAMGRLHLRAAPVIGQSGGSGNYTDPLPQALVLTAIVISFAMTAFAIVLALRSYSELGSDHVDGPQAHSGQPSGSAKPSRKRLRNKTTDSDLQDWPT